MKFSEVESNTWEELRPYLDTCLLPVAGLSGKEQPYEVTAALLRLRDMMDLVEIPFKGRVVTYPTVQYGRDNIFEFINEISHNVKSSGFRFVVVITSDVLLHNSYLPDVDLVLSLQSLEGSEALPNSMIIQNEIQRIWHRDNQR